MPAGATPVVADLSDAASLQALSDAEGIRQVVYSASADGRTDDAYARAYVHGLTNVLRAVEQHAIERVVFTASTAVYHQTEGWVDERSPTEPTSFTGQRLLEGERVLHSFDATTVSLRLAGIYGPGRTRMVQKVESGQMGADRFTNRIHREDCAGALEHILDLATPQSVYVGVDHATAPLSEVAAFIATQLGVAPPSFDAPPTGKRCRHTALSDSGYTFRVPSYREGYPEIIDGYRQA